MAKGQGGDSWYRWRWVYSRSARRGGIRIGDAVIAGMAVLLMERVCLVSPLLGCRLGARQNRARRSIPTLPLVTRMRNRP